MNIAISRYELTPNRRQGGEGSKPRAGALIRYEFGPGLFGYGDCHPWPELGDETLKVQLEILRTGGTTIQLDRTFALAKIDAEARAGREWLFDGLDVPESHATFPYALGVTESRAIAESRLDELGAMGFGIVKIKVGQSPVVEIAELARIFPALKSRALSVRFDFNERLSYEDVRGFMNALLGELGDDMEGIDWIEDPCPFDPENWDRLRGEFGLELAVDRCAGRLEMDRDQPIDILVFKPAVTEPDIAFELAAELDVPIAVTSYLDHPLGQVSAAWVAARALRDKIPQVSGGLATHLAYEPNRFSEELLVEDARLIPPPGTGFGFDEALEEIQWSAL